MDKLQLTGQKLGRVFSFESGNLHSAYLWCYRVKLPNLKLKNLVQTTLGSHPLDIAFPRLGVKADLTIPFLNAVSVPSGEI